MKKNIVSILAYSLLGLSTIMVSCGGDSKSGDAHKTETVASEMAFLRADISGMTCAIGCAKPIEKMLNELEGVTSAEIDFEKKAAFINYDKAKVSEADLLKAVSEFKDGSYSAKLSDKNCKSECKKTCCAAKDVKKTVTKATDKAKETTNVVVKDLSNTATRNLNTKTNTTIKTDGHSVKTSDVARTTSKATGKTINTTNKAVKATTNQLKDGATRQLDKATTKTKKAVQTTTKNLTDGATKQLDKATSKKMPQ